MLATIYSSTSRSSKKRDSRPTTKTWNASRHKPTTTRPSRILLKFSRPRWPLSAASTKTGSRRFSGTQRSSNTTTASSTSLCPPTTTQTCAIRHSVHSLGTASPDAALRHRPRSPAASRALPRHQPSRHPTVSACTVTHERTRCADGLRHHRHPSVWCHHRTEEHRDHHEIAALSEHRRLLRRPPTTQGTGTDPSCPCIYYYFFPVILEKHPRHALSGCVSYSFLFCLFVCLDPA